MTGNVVAHLLNNGTHLEIVSDFKKQMILKAYEQSFKMMCLVPYIYCAQRTSSSGGSAAYDIGLPKSSYKYFICAKKVCSY